MGTTASAGGPASGQNFVDREVTLSVPQAAWKQIRNTLTATTVDRCARKATAQPLLQITLELQSGITQT